MPIRLIHAARSFSFIGLMLGAFLLPVVEVGQATAGDQSSLGQPRPTPAQYPDGSARTSPAPTAAPPLPVPPDGAKPLQSTLPPSAAETSPATAEPRHGAPLTPIPEAKYLGPAEIEVTSFHGITPGASNHDDVTKAWGKPKQSRKLDAGSMELYAVDPFPRVEVAYSNDNRVTSLVIRFQRGVPRRTGRRAIGAFQSPARPDFQ